MTEHCLWVYPRAYGGTQETRRRAWYRQGLSPRVRGNRRQASDAKRPPGSIPARTGEPGGALGDLCSSAVYPRAYGGTDGPLRLPGITYGLSPRVRGNHGARMFLLHLVGSIPARTGGTQMSAAVMIGARGLSPRVRGNLAGSMRGE